MRNPSVHLRKSDLISSFREMGYNDEDALFLSDELLRIGSKYSVKNRVFVYSTRKADREKIVKAVASTESDVELFNRILDATRKKNNHRFVRQILKNDKDYQMLKDIATIAEDFCTMFGSTNKQSGFQEFCELGIKLMGKKYALNKFKYYKSHIFDLKESILVIREDRNKKGTEEFYDVYKKMMMIYGNLTVDLLNPFNPEKFKHIVYGRQEADENGAKYKDWVKAQFEGLQFLGVVPELSQFYGDKAKERYERFYTKENKPETVDETKIVDYKSESEQRYWEMIRNKKQ